MFPETWNHQCCVMGHPATDRSHGCSLSAPFRLRRPLLALCPHHLPNHWLPLGYCRMGDGDAAPKVCEINPVQASEPWCSNLYVGHSPGTLICSFHSLPVSKVYNQITIAYVEDQCFICGQNLPILSNYEV